jgi:hypothetical protein
MKIAISYHIVLIDLSSQKHEDTFQPVSSFLWGIRDAGLFAKYSLLAESFSSRLLSSIKSEVERVTPGRSLMAMMNSREMPARGNWPPRLMVPRQILDHWTLEAPSERFTGAWWPMVLIEFARTAVIDNFLNANQEQAEGSAQPRHRQFSWFLSWGDNDGPVNENILIGGSRLMGFSRVVTDRVSDKMNRSCPQSSPTDFPRSLHDVVYTRNQDILWFRSEFSAWIFPNHPFRYCQKSQIAYCGRELTHVIQFSYHHRCQTCSSLRSENIRLLVWQQSWSSCQKLFRDPAGH